MRSGRSTPVTWCTRLPTPPTASGRPARTPRSGVWPSPSGRLAPARWTTAEVARMSPNDARPESVPAVTLNDGHSIPQLGFGVFQIPPADTETATATALEIGYRHIDTAEMYGNEKEVGRAVAQSGLDRSEVFVTSKLNNGFHRPEAARGAFDRTLGELGFEYVDLFLIHWPLPTLYGGDFVSTWKVMIEFHLD